MEWAFEGLFLAQCANQENSRELRWIWFLLILYHGYVHRRWVPCEMFSFFLSHPRLGKVIFMLRMPNLFEYALPVFGEIFLFSDVLRLIWQLLWISYRAPFAYQMPVWVVLEIVYKMFPIKK